MNVHLFENIHSPLFHSYIIGQMDNMFIDYECVDNKIDLIVTTYVRNRISVSIRPLKNIRGTKYINMNLKSIDRLLVTESILGEL